MNVFKALVYFHPDYETLQHPRFRVLLAHAMLTLGKATFGQVNECGDCEGPEEGYCKLAKFTDYANEKHQCG